MAPPSYPHLTPPITSRATKEERHMPEHEEIASFTVGAQLVALRHLSLQKNSDNLRQIVPGEGVFVEEVTKSQLKFRSMADDRVGWVSVTAGDLRVVMPAAKQIRVESRKVEIHGVYTLLEADKFGSPIYRRDSVTLSFNRANRAWTFVSNDTICSISSVAWKPTVIPVNDLRKSQVICIGPFQSDAPILRALPTSELFVDKDFPPEWISIDNEYGPTESYKYEWVRVDELVPGQTIDIFGCLSNGERVSHPDDVYQGALGDCWFLAGIASMAEVRGLIKSMFVDGPKLKPDGTCRVRLFDPLARSFTEVLIDTLIPCSRKPDGTVEPAFAMLSKPFLPHCDPDSPPRRACWPLLLEKAAAKYVRSYMNLTGGLVTSAYQLCGCGDEQTLWSSIGRPNFLSLMLNTAVQQSYLKTQVAKNPKIVPINDIHFYDEGTIVGTPNMHKTMRRLQNDENHLLSAGTTSGGNGIVQGHAYTILQTVSVKTNAEVLNFVQLRNPWGTGEWTGPWSDADSQWEKFPQVLKLLKPLRDSRDGTFFMLSEDFFKYFGALFQSSIPSSFQTLEFVTRMDQSLQPSLKERTSCFGSKEKKPSFAGPKPVVKDVVNKMKLCFPEHK